MNKASFSLYSPQGVRVYFEMEDTSIEYVVGDIDVFLATGFTVQEPVPEAGEKRYRITRYTHTTQRQDNGTELPVINLWDENGSYPQLTVYPTTYLDGTQVTSDIIHLFTDMGDVTPTDMTQRDKVKHDCWGRVNLTAIGVPKLDHEGNVVHTNSGYVKYRFLKVEGTSTKPQVTSDSDSEAEDGKPTTLKGALEYAKSLSIPAEAASAGMQRLVRDLFDVPQGQERDFLLSAENGKVDMVVQAYITWADEWVNMAHHAAMEEQELPF